MTLTLWRDNPPTDFPAAWLASSTRSRRRSKTRTDLNLHAYVGADPVNAVDPSGLTPQAVICTGTRLGCPVQQDGRASGLNPASSGNSDHVGQTNWAAVKRDPNPVPFTITGTISGVDGTFTGTVTLGGRFEGITASINTAQFSGLMSASSRFSDGRIRHEPTGDGMFGASPIWWARLDRINGGKFNSYLGSYLEAIMTGQVTATRQTLEARREGLPGGGRTFYQRYEIPGSAAFPDVFSGARVAWQPGSPLIYLGPYHGEPHPLVPQGWIRLRYGPRGE